MLVNTPPTGACFAKIRFYGAQTNTGSSWFDDVRIIPDPINRVPTNMQAFASSGSFVVPDYVNRIRVRAWGAGGGGGGGDDNANFYPGGGGGGGSFADGILSVTPGETLTITVGAAGVGGAALNAGAGFGTAGGDTKVLRGATPIFTAGGGGGGGGGSNGAAGAGGTAGTSSETIVSIGYAGSAGTGVLPGVGGIAGGGNIIPAPWDGTNIRTAGGAGGAGREQE